MSGISEDERDERISKAIAHADHVASGDVSSFLKDFRAQFYSQQETPTRTFRTARSIDNTRPPSSPLRLARVDESQVIKDERFLKNMRLLLNKKAYGTKRILGGIAVTESEYSDCVAVGNDYDWNCSGTLIANNAVLTAGHCKCGGAPTRVFFGNDVHQKGKVVRVKNVARHPEYIDSIPTNDLMVLFLDEKVPSGLAKPRPLATSKLIDKATDVTLVGFGRTDELALAGYGLKRQVEVAIASNDCKGCVDGVKDRKYYGCRMGVELVAGQPALNRDTCSGDSGGPLYISDSHKNFFLAGVTSRATVAPNKLKKRVCGDGGVYARVDRYRDWIESVLGDPAVIR